MPTPGAGTEAGGPSTPASRLPALQGTDSGREQSLENCRRQAPEARLIIGILVATLLIGCSRSGALSPDDPIFKGLPRAAVVETLSLPRVQTNLEGISTQQQRSLAQASVRTLIACREALRVYLAWIRTGAPPKVSPGPVPENPIEPGNSAVEQEYTRLKAAVASGDPDELRAMLLAEGGCGPNWPAEPGGPTIAEVVQEQGA